MLLSGMARVNHPVIKTLYNSFKGDYVVEWNGKSEPLSDWLKR